MCITDQEQIASLIRKRVSANSFGASSSADRLEINKALCEEFKKVSDQLSCADVDEMLEQFLSNEREWGAYIDVAEMMVRAKPMTLSELSINKIWSVVQDSEPVIYKKSLFTGAERAYANPRPDYAYRFLSNLGLIK